MGVKPNFLEIGQHGYNNADFYADFKSKVKINKSAPKIIIIKKFYFAMDKSSRWDTLFPF